MLGLDRGGAASGLEPQRDTIALDLAGIGDAREHIEADVRISTTKQISLQQLCEAGMGIAPLFLPDAHPALERGALVRLLPNWRLPSLPVTLITHGRSDETAKVRVAADALKRYFSALPATG